MRRQLTLKQYIKRRNGVALGQPGSLRNMLVRSLGAPSPARFWHYWNPLFGYYLGRCIFSPTKRWLPAPLALVTTFVFCGALHDAVASVEGGRIVVLFTPWFLVMAMGVIAGQVLRLDCSNLTWPFRALINLSYVGVSLAVVLVAQVYVL